MMPKPYPFVDQKPQDIRAEYHARPSVISRIWGIIHTKIASFFAYIGHNIQRWRVQRIIDANPELKKKQEDVQKNPFNYFPSVKGCEVCHGPMNLSPGQIQRWHKSCKPFRNRKISEIRQKQLQAEALLQ